MTRRRIASFVALGAVAFAGLTLYQSSTTAVDVVLVNREPETITRVEIEWRKGDAVAVSSVWPFEQGSAPAEMSAPPTLEAGPYRLTILVERDGFPPVLQEREVELRADGIERILLPGPPPRP